MPTTTNFILLFTLIYALSSQCPITAYQSDILTGSLTIANSNFPGSPSNVTISPSQQVKTYSHLLSRPFTKQPQIATSISDFAAQSTAALYLSIKPYLVGDGIKRLNSLSFAIRTQWKYTTWKRFKFSFIAEERPDIEAGIYQIQTNVLNSYQQTKQLQLFFPYRTNFRESPTVTTFLTGFVISLILNSSYTSPLEIQQRILTRNITGFSLSLTVTSGTLVSELVISYVAYDSRLISKVVSSTAVYDDYLPQSTVTKNVANTISGNLREVFHGLNGFILVLRPNFDIQLDTTFASTSKDFSWSSTTSIFYLAYSYLALIGNRCSLCQGFPYFHLASCLAACPVGTFSINETCVACPSGTNWNGSMCVTVCSGGRTWNALTLSCQCPVGLFWTGSVCSSCPQGQEFNAQLAQCLCVLGNWNGTACVLCHASQVWNQYSFKCQCRLGSFWKGASCILCTNGRVWDPKSSSCVCQPGLNFDGKNCIMCTGGTFWNDSTLSCQCSQGTAWNGSKCITLCPAGQAWSTTALRCSCPLSTNWNGSACITCQQNQFFSPSTNKCECIVGYRLELNGSCSVNCPQNQVFNGSQCVSICPIGSYYNGNSCVTFIPSCPIGTQWSSYQCVPITNTCPTGMTWNGLYCISSQSQCLQGYFYWNGTACASLSQRCPFPLEWKNNMCMPTTNNCPSGAYFNGYLCIFYDDCEPNMVWNKTLVKCVCVEGTFWNGAKCVTCDSGMTYTADGCVCPSGSVFNGLSCILSNEIGCKSMPDASWNGTHCVCLPGYSAIDGRCVCFGLEMTGWCNRCYQKANSLYKNGICICLQGFIQQSGQCTNQLQYSSLPITKQSACPVSTFWQSQRKQCLSCSEGCLSCIDCYKCLQCNVGYVYNAITQLCEQVCGDGKRFNLQCDDGNNINSDGCSMDCKVETGYTCEGGSPNSVDKCTQFVPREVQIVQTGQARLFGKIVISLRINYLPTNLTSMLRSCRQSCMQLLNTTVLLTKQSPSVTADYIGGAFNSLSLTIDFRKEPIEKFRIELSLNPEIRQKYLPSISSGNGLSITVEPIFLTLLVEKDYIK